MSQSERGLASPKNQKPASLSEKAAFSPPGTISNGSDILGLKDVLFMWEFDARRLDHATEVLNDYVALCKHAASIIQQLSLAGNDVQKLSPRDAQTQWKQLHELLHKAASRGDFKDYFGNIFDKVGPSFLGSARQ